MKSYLIIGSNGQLGRALQNKYPQAKAVDVSELDITDKQAIKNFDWSDFEVILNAAAYTKVDEAETPKGREAAEKVNSEAVANLADVASKHNIILVHISTDYVFDGTKTPHKEDEQFSPLSVYGLTKAGGDKAVAKVPRHYILRTSWVIGDGKNFVRTMLELGKNHINPTVVNDQVGRLTFTSELVRAIDHLLTHNSAFGTYNITNDGESVSWADITREIFKYAGLSNTVTGVSTAQYYTDKNNIALRPLQSTLDLSKIEAAGFIPRGWRDDLAAFVNKEVA